MSSVCELECGKVIHYVCMCVGVGGIRVGMRVECEYV